VTRMSESKTRSVVAIGDRCVIPAKAGIQVSAAAMTERKLGPGLRRGDGQFVIPAKAGIQVSKAAMTNRKLGPGLRRGDD
jgi:hypothetical protein